MRGLGNENNHKRTMIHNGSIHRRRDRWLTDYADFAIFREEELLIRRKK